MVCTYFEFENLRTPTFTRKLTRGTGMHVCITKRGTTSINFRQHSHSELYLVCSKQRERENSRAGQAAGSWSACV